MNATRLGRLARMLRVRQRLTQVALASRAGVSRRAVSTLELGRAHQLPFATIEAIAQALGGRIDLRLLWNGPELDRLLDEGHAALGAAVKQRLERWGWLVQVEVSYSRWGERGRIDLLAFHPATRIVLAIELKTLLVDVQTLLGTLDAKATAFTRHRRPLRLEASVRRAGHRVLGESDQSESRRSGERSLRSLLPPRPSRRHLDAAPRRRFRTDGAASVRGSRSEATVQLDGAASTVAEHCDLKSARARASYPFHGLPNPDR